LICGSALLAHKSKNVVCWAMGLTQDKKWRYATIKKEYINLLLVKGGHWKTKCWLPAPFAGPQAMYKEHRSVGIMHFVDKRFK